MSIHHHLDEATLSSYAAGTLPQGMALVVACHLSDCPHCSASLATHQACGGALFEALTPAEVQEESLQKVLAMLDEVPCDEPLPEVMAAPVKREVPLPLAQMVGESLDDLEWKRIVPGVSYFDLPNNGQGVSRLLRLAPGKAMLAHSHGGSELTLVLRGSFTDEIGRFCAGDVADLDEEVEHQPLVDSDCDCICLVATDAPLRFSNWLGRLMQPITGF